MPFSIQQTNSTSRLVKALAEVKDAYYQALEDKEAAALIGIPANVDFPPPGELDHITRGRLQNVHGVVDVLKAFLTTPVVLFAGNPAKSPLDAIVESIR